MFYISLNRLRETPKSVDMWAFLELKTETGKEKNVYVNPMVIGLGSMDFFEMLSSKKLNKQ